MRHVSDRLAWIDPGYQMDVFSEDEVSGSNPAVVKAFGRADIFFATAVADGPGAAVLCVLSDGVPTALTLGCGPELEGKYRLGGVNPNDLSGLQALFANLPWSAEARALKLKVRG